MRERRYYFRFAFKPGQCLRVLCEVLWQDLNRNFTIQSRVARTVHHSHSTCTNRSEDSIRTQARRSSEHRGITYAKFQQFWKARSIGHHWDTVKFKRSGREIVRAV